MQTPVPWPDPAREPPPAFDGLAWGAPLPDAVPTRGAAFGADWRVEVATELGEVVLVRLAALGGPALDARLLAALGYARVDEGLLARVADGTRTECDLLDQTITMTEAP